MWRCMVGIKDMSETKQCKGCDQILPVELFSRKSNPNKCKHCLNVYNRDYYNTNYDRHLHRSRRYRSTTQGRVKLIMAQIRARTKKLGLPITLQESVIAEKIEAGVCEASGLPLNLDDVRAHWDNPLGPSLDRIESGEGYTDKNVQLVCNMYNRGKNKHPEIDFIAMCVAVAERHADDPAVQQRLCEWRSER